MDSNAKNVMETMHIDDVFEPEIFRLDNTLDHQAMKQLLAMDSTITIHDTIGGQLRELIKSNNPSIKISDNEYPARIKTHLNGLSPDEYGVWVYYPWSKKLVHLLDEAEFIEVRTNRNRYKITREEQDILSRKKCGIVGLSVGQSIALTIAIERTCGELRLADFDTVELSNLNRIRTGLQNLGLKKTVIAAREIFEIDPYLKVRIFNDGLTNQNIDAFFTGHGKLDMLVEVCDGLDVKIISRFKARDLRIPVVMDTNDRGMLDVERYDLEPERPVLHGLAGDLDPQKIAGLTNEQKIPYILAMIGADTISSRLKASMLEVEQSINTWPQLASSVTLGGAITTDVCRNIFLDKFHDSGRYYIDIEDIIKDRHVAVTTDNANKYDGPAKLSVADLKSIAQQYKISGSPVSVEAGKLNEIIQAACLAPSGGNAQPWQFLYQENRLYIFHDACFSYSLLDFNKSGSYIAFGAMLENIKIKAAAMSLSVVTDIFPLPNDHRLIMVVSFQDDGKPYFSHLEPVIGARMTNRNISERKMLVPDDMHALTSIASGIPGAQLQWFDTEDHLNEFAEILTDAEKLRFLHPQGHYDTFVKELRFTREEVESSNDGLDVNTLNLKPSDIAALQVAKDPAAISYLHQWHKGSGFKKISRKNVLTASCIGVVSMHGKSPLHFFDGGRAVEKIWLEANGRQISFQPISQIVFLTELLHDAGNIELSPYELKELAAINERFNKIIRREEGRFPVFVFRLCYAAGSETRSLRKPIHEVFHDIRQPGT
ncbi:MAG: Rv1355c family protein [Chitinophagaceae bacterium]